MKTLSFAVSGARRFGVLVDDDQVMDITALDKRVDTFTSALSLSRDSGVSLNQFLKEGIEQANQTYSFNSLQVPPNPDAPYLLEPVSAPEVWCAGVTYRISRAAREDESTLPEIYRKVYDADRPELFFKSTGERILGPNDYIGIKSDSGWDVPVGELGVVIDDSGIVVGYTVGNDVSSKQIEGQNPLYLPQAKIYDRSCSMGPVVTLPEAISDPHSLKMSVKIKRGGREVFEGKDNTSSMKRSM